MTKFRDKRAMFGRRVKNFVAKALGGTERPPGKDQSEEVQDWLTKARANWTAWTDPNLLIHPSVRKAVVQEVRACPFYESNILNTQILEAFALCLCTNAFTSEPGEDFKTSVINCGGEVLIEALVMVKDNATKVSAMHAAVNAMGED